MPVACLYQLLADTVLILHFAVVLFVIGGLVLILIGNRFMWPWVNKLWFRVAHLASITVVVTETWLGLTCPLTTLESLFRIKTGSLIYGESFIEYWLHYLIFYEAPPWIFMVTYTVFGILVVAVWWHFPPKLSKSTNKRDDP